MGACAAKRRTSLWGPFVVVSVSSILALGYCYFEIFSNFSSYVLPRIAEAHCDGSAAHRTLDYWPIRPTNETCSRLCTCDDLICPPTPQKVVVQEKIVERVVDSGPIFNQWWAKGKAWHHPGRFPLCSMDACFNYTRCENMDELLVYHYDIPIPPNRYFEGFNLTPWFTADPNKACLFFVFQDAESPFRPHPNTLRHWNYGLNHVLVTFADLWPQKNPPEDTIENASVLSTGLLGTNYRPGFDIGIPLDSRGYFPYLQSRKPSERKYFLTFKGIRYLGRRNTEGVFRSYPSLRGMHNGNDVIVVATCDHLTNDLKRMEQPELGDWCDADQKHYDEYSFEDLMNSTFSLAPAGVSGSSYRFIEVLSAGAIPVLIADNHVRPFENIIQWPRCALQFPTSEMQRILPALRGMTKTEIEARQKYCLWVYNEFLKDDATMLRSVMRALKARFFGMFAEFSDLSYLHTSEESEKEVAASYMSPHSEPLLSIQR